MSGASSKGRRKGVEVFGYGHLPFKKYALIQIALFPVLALGVLVYYQKYSKWKGAFMHVPSAYRPVLEFLGLFLILALFQPVRDLLTVRNERIEIAGDTLSFYNLFGQRKLSVKLHEVRLLRAGLPLTSRTKRYVFVADGKSFFFSAEIENVERLLRLLELNPDQTPPD